MHALTFLLTLLAQRPDSFAASVREYIAVDTSLMALTHVLLVDGTGAAPKTDQTVVIRAGKIAAVGAAASVPIPAGARAVQMGYTGSHLYLGSGVTTIRTTGSRSPYAEINLKDWIDHGLAPGPRIHLTAPYITGERGGGAMAILNRRRRRAASWTTGRPRARPGSKRIPTFGARSWAPPFRKRTNAASRSRATCA